MSRAIVHTAILLEPREIHVDLYLPGYMMPNIPIPHLQVVTLRTDDVTLPLIHVLICLGQYQHIKTVSVSLTINGVDGIYEKSKRDWREVTSAMRTCSSRTIAV